MGATGNKILRALMQEKSQQYYPLVYLFIMRLLFNEPSINYTINRAASHRGINKSVIWIASCSIIMSYN